MAIAYVYCDFSAQNVQSARAILGSVLRQVVGALTEIPDEVQKAFEQSKRQVDSCGLRLPEILALLAKSLSGLKRTFICIDALDELPFENRPELWESLQCLVKNCPSARLFLTGRPHIRDQAREYFSRTAEMLPVSPSADDIGLYLKRRLGRDPEPDAMNQCLRAEILRVILSRIPGMYVLSRDN